MTNKPTIPIVGDGTVTIKQAGVSKGTFTMNQSDNTTIELTDTWRGIQNNLTSDSTTDSLSAAQGKVLKGLVDGKAASSHKQAYTSSECTTYTSDVDTVGITPAAVKKAITEVFEPKSHTHNYLPLSGGTLTDELVIDTGNEAEGIYFVNPSDKSKGTRVSYVDGSPFVQGAWNAVVLKENGTLLSNKYATYEEGTWTPSNTPSASTDTSVYEFKNSEYRKIGDIVILATTATPTNLESKVGYLMIVKDSFPFAFGRILSTFSINTNGNSSIGVCNNYGSTYDFGEYNFNGNSWGLTDVYVTIIYSL